MTKKECFILVEVNCFGVIVLLSPHITGCRLDSWEDLMEYMVIFENKRFSKDANTVFFCFFL